MDIGNQIRERRARLGLSQDELAQRLYVSRVTISHWEMGVRQNGLTRFCRLIEFRDATTLHALKQGVP